MSSIVQSANDPSELRTRYVIAMSFAHPPQKNELGCTSIFPHGNAFWVARGTFTGGIFFTDGASRGNPVPSGALRGGRWQQEAVVFGGGTLTGRPPDSTQFQCSFSKHCTHLLPKTDVAKDSEILLHPANTSLLLERSVLLNGLPMNFTSKTLS